MTIESIIEAAAAAAKFADATAKKEAVLKAEMLAARAAGVPLTSIAQAAGVSRPTAMKWIDQAKEATK